MIALHLLQTFACSNTPRMRYFIYGLIYGLIYDLIYGLIWGLIYGLTYGFIYSLIYGSEFETRSLPTKPFPIKSTISRCTKLPYTPQSSPDELVSPSQCFLRCRVWAIAEWVCTITPRVGRSWRVEQLHPPIPLDKRFFSRQGQVAWKVWTKAGTVFLFVYRQLITVHWVGGEVEDGEMEEGDHLESLDYFGETSPISTEKWPIFELETPQPQFFTFVLWWGGPKA